MKKVIGHTVSVFKNTNKVISSSETDWATIKPGSYFKLNKDNIFYTVADKAPIYFIKDFEVTSNLKIKINSNIGPYLINGDVLYLSYKEYELFTLISIANGGTGYKINDVISVSGGSPSIDVKTGVAEPTSFTVTKVSPEGSILELGPNNKGKYIEKPPVASAVVDGNGFGAVLELDYTLIDNRTTFERTVTKVELDDKFTEVTLDSPLPKGLKIGKLSVEKWEITLSSNYLGETAINEYFQICRDFSPYYRLPLAGKGSLSMDTLYNQSIITLDDLIGGFEDRIVALEEEIKSLKSKII